MLNTQGETVTDQRRPNYVSLISYPSINLTGFLATHSG